ncbi:MAG: capsular exopolysaccharide synthesis family protein [Polaribacter sp.]|jgi:capsular exopolysaccharide synthesis family protein|uniref:GumC family protein n=1 Tax=Candidatus Marifrigoribacter sp. Uisw_064 TaxID=3230970 RepID=UPI003D3FDCB8
MNEDFEINDVHSTFDIKSFLFKLLNYWPLFLISIAIGFSIAYYINVRKLPVYQIENLISIKDDQNPFFTSNTSLTFNWGGTTDKVNTSVITLQSRSHNEKVVERLQYYLNYYKDGKYQQEDAYKNTPFSISIDTSQFQILNKQLKVVFKDSVTFNLSTTFTGGNVSLQKYSSKENKIIFINPGEFSSDYKLGEKIDEPFFKGTIMPNLKLEVQANIPYYFSLLNFDSAVKSFLTIKITPISRGSSVLKLSLLGKNKNRIVDYLNGSVDVLSENMLERKNLFATKTIKFIDSSLAYKSKELIDVEDELNKFKNKNDIYDLEIEGEDITQKLNTLDLREEGVNRELNYYTILEGYLINRNDYRQVPAPSVAGIKESSVIGGVGRIIQLAEQRTKLEYSYKDDAPIFKDIDRQINAVKDVLLENINSSKSLKNIELNKIKQDINRFESEIRRLPKEQQELLKIERRYNLSQGTYNLFLEKRSEAGLVKAANVSDVLVIDSAKDTGGAKVGPNTQFNYLLAILFGLFIPILFIFLKVFFDTKISSVKDIERLSRIPILGVIGKSRLENNLAVLNKPKSSIAEAFRGIRSSLQFMYKKQGLEGAKTVLVTSSVSGEGKTFCSINIASVFSLSKKKTVIVGLDLRKPKIFGDFDIDNTIGVVNYLIHDASLSDIIQKTQLDHLDVITSGPIPPNPSELLMGEAMEELISELKKEYDYIILDSPPLGLVADALELTKFVDATIYMVRQNYTKKGMFSIINDKYKKGEVTNISFVLNFFEEKEKYGYGYGYGYGSYGNSYHENDEKKSLLRKIKDFLKLDNKE